MRVKFKRFSFGIRKLEKTPTRFYSVNGEIVSNIRPLCEIGVDDRKSFKIYYIGVYKLLIYFAVMPKNYKPEWIVFEESLKKCIDFNSFKRRNGRILHKFNKKPTE